MMEKWMGCRPTRIEVELDAIAHNFRVLGERLPKGAEILAMVKANAYGHGAVGVAKQALKSGVSQLGVATFAEAMELRAANIDAPILIVGYTAPSCWQLAREQHISLTFYDERQIDQAIEILPNEGEPLEIHVKVDTGMGRLGFTQIESLVRSCQKIVGSGKLKLTGLFTHFAKADEEDSAYTVMQRNRFQECVDRLKAVGIVPRYIHSNNSAGSIRFPEWSTPLCRIGISAYGLYPSTYLKSEQQVELRPVLTLKSEIVHLKEVPPHTAISYGGTYVTTDWAKIATVPIGYGDGYFRSLSNCGEVLVRGMRAKIAGRVTMDQLMIDVTHIPQVDLGDEVVLIGRQGSECISADEIAELVGTINYEITTALAHRVPRIYI